MPKSKDEKILRVLMGLCLLFALSIIMTGCGSSNLTSTDGEISISPEGATLDATKTQQFIATVRNTSNQHVSWKISGCSLNDCGFINSAGLYTAPSVIPSPATVSIKATSLVNPDVFTTVKVNLLPLSIVISEDSINMCANESHQFTAFVSRHTNTSVTWSLSGCTASDCGSIDTSGLYTSPSSIPNHNNVVITATSQADPTKFAAVTVHNMPITVSITPHETIISPGASLDFRANVKYDIRNQGVTWSLEQGCSPEVCGILTDYERTSVKYTASQEAPIPCTVKLFSASVSDTGKTSEANITILNSLTLLKEGDYAFYFNGDGNYKDTNTVWLAAAGRFHVDGRGSITDGIQDMNLQSGVYQSVPFTGTYTVSPDYLGSFDITTPQGTSTYIMTVDSSGMGGKFISIGSLVDNSSISVTGHFELQDKSAFSLSSIAGPYVIGISSGWREMSAVGRFNTDTTGNIRGGRMDTTEFIYDGGYFTPSYTQNLILAGLISEPSSSTGRGTATVTLSPTPQGGASTYNFAYYIISDQKILLVQIDDRISDTTVLSGEMRRQEGLFNFSSFDAPVIFNLSGISIYESAAAVGRITPDGAGSVTGTIDQDGSFWATLSPIRNREFIGSYDIEPDGRSQITLDLREPGYVRHNLYKPTYVAYFFDQNRGILMQTSGAILSSIGGFKPQAIGPFTLDSLSETFRTNTIPGISIACTEKSSGLTTFDFTGNVTSSMDINRCSDISKMEFTGQYAVDETGRGTIMFNGQVDREMVFWIISTEEFVAISTVTADEYWEPALIEHRK